MTLFDQSLSLLPANLKNSVSESVEKYPDIKDTIQALIDHFSSNLIETNVKKRKLNDANELPLQTLTDISFQTPRRKVNIEFYASKFILRSKDKTELSALYSDIILLLQVSTPAKQKPSTTFIIASKKEKFPENFIFSIENTMSISVKESDQKLSLNDLSSFLAFYMKIPPSYPQKHIFSSKSSHKEIHYHVHCYIKAKETFIYFLENGLFFGFGKPSGWINLNWIVDAIIHGTTSRTFDLSIEYYCDWMLETESVMHEFGNIDNAELDRIDEYLEINRKLFRNTGTTKVYIKKEIDVKKEERHLTNKITHVKDVNSSDDEEFIGNSSEGSLREEWDSEYNTNSEIENDDQDNHSSMSSDSNIHGNYSVQISPKKSEISRQYVKSMIDDFRSTASILRCEGIRSPMNDKDGNDIEVVSHTFLNSQIDELNESDCDI